MEVGSEEVEVGDASVGHEDDFSGCRFSRPRMHLMSVVLPPPFGPMMPRKSRS